MNTSEFESRLRSVLFFFIAVFGFLWVRLFYIQVVRGENLRTIAETNRTTLLFEQAPRGLILDRNGLVLADSKPTFVVLFTPLDLKEDVFSGVIHRLALILKEDDEKLQKRLQPAIQHSSLVRVMDRASRSTAFALAEQRPNLPGVSVVREMQRRYPQGSLAAHLLGYIGQISPEEFQGLRAEGYQSEWLIGKMGLERTYDAFLRGKHGGTRIEVDAYGRSVKILDRKEPLAGYQIQTTLDLKIQKAAEEALAETGKAGAVVAMDPRNGEILAFASAPSFDPNIFLYERGERAAALPEASAGGGSPLKARPDSQMAPVDLLTRSDLPLFNRPIQGTYAPGSIFKIVVAAAALESKKMKPSDVFMCPGYYMLGGPGGKKFMCWKHTGHGKMSLLDAVINSCTVYFYQAGLHVGPDPIEIMAKRFGLGKQTGLEFRGERSGLIPGRTMFQTGKRRWFDGDTLNMAIGQGTVLFTPIQAVQMISAVANRGTLYRPRLVKEILTPANEPYAKSASEVMSHFTLSDETWNFLDEALSEVVDNGTGQSCKIPGIRIGGKTGTAQNPHGKDHAWFVAYAPVGNPVIAVSVLVEHGIKGSVAAAPVARKVILAALADSAAIKPEAVSSHVIERVSGD